MKKSNRNLSHIKAISKEWWESQYIGHKKTISQISMELGCDNNLVRQCLHVFNIPLRRTGNEPTSSLIKPETKLFIRMVRDALDKRGLSADSASQYLFKYGLVHGSTHLSYLLNGKRGVTFWKAVKIANSLDIDLGELQRKCKIVTKRS